MFAGQNSEGGGGDCGDSNGLPVPVGMPVPASALGRGMTAADPMQPRGGCEVVQGMGLAGGGVSIMAEEGLEILQYALWRSQES